MLGFLFIYLIMVDPIEREKMLADEEIDALSIIIQNNEFIPSEIEISVGTKLIWINRDNTKHRISGADFKSSVLNPGERYSYRFNQIGIFEYGCEFHPGMSGKIIVK